jgi:hypothetical protein
MAYSVDCSNLQQAYRYNRMKSSKLVQNQGAAEIAVMAIAASWD